MSNSQYNEHCSIKIKTMKIVRLLIMLTAFLIMISSVVTLFSTTERTPVYINIAAMVVLMVIIALLNFQKNKENNRHV